jgi:hypothetical protein
MTGPGAAGGHGPGRGALARVDGPDVGVGAVAHEHAAAACVGKGEEAARARPISAAARVRVPRAGGCVGARHGDTCPRDSNGGHTDAAEP